MKQEKKEIKKIKGMSIDQFKRWRSRKCKKKRKIEKWVLNINWHTPASRKNWNRSATKIAIMHSQYNINTFPQKVKKKKFLLRHVCVNSCCYLKYCLACHCYPKEVLWMFIWCIFCRKQSDISVRNLASSDRHRFGLCKECYSTKSLQELNVRMRWICEHWEEEFNASWIY